MSTDPNYGRRPRPLMPRAFTSCNSNSRTFSTTPTHCCSLHNPNTNQPLSGVSDHGAKRETSRVLPVVSSRWNPTPEQLQALQEMYRRGTKTPSAEQIQQIAAKLRRFGKIEGKNVFYWFQNHKARDRQKKRRQLELLPGKDMPDYEQRQSGLSRRSYLEIEHPKELPTKSNCSTTSKYSESMHGGLAQECKRDEWTQLDKEELQQQTVAAKSTETCCWPLDLSSCMHSNNYIQKITDHQKAPGQENAYPYVTLDICKLLIPKNDINFINFEGGIEENQTLQLFPVRSNNSSSVSAAKEDSHDVSSVGTKLVPNQFFEFLPTKN